MVSFLFASLFLFFCLPGEGGGGGGMNEWMNESAMKRRRTDRQTDKTHIKYIKEKKRTNK